MKGIQIQNTQNDPVPGCPYCYECADGLPEDGNYPPEREAIKKLPGTMGYLKMATIHQIEKAIKKLPGTMCPINEPILLYKQLWGIE